MTIGGTEDLVERLLAPPGRTASIVLDSVTCEFRLRLDRLEPDAASVDNQRRRLQVVAYRLAQVLDGQVRSTSNHWRIGVAGTVWSDRAAQLTTWIQSNVLSMLVMPPQEPRERTVSAAMRATPRNALDTAMADQLLTGPTTHIGPSTFVVVGPRAFLDHHGGTVETGSGPVGGALTPSSGLARTGEVVIAIVDGVNRTWIRGGLILRTPTLADHERAETCSDEYLGAGANSLNNRLRYGPAAGYDINHAVEVLSGHTLVFCTVSAVQSKKDLVVDAMRDALRGLLDDFKRGQALLDVIQTHQRHVEIRSASPSYAASRLSRTLALV